MKPYPFQKQGVFRIRDFQGRAILADEMGLGKTPQAIWWMYKAQPWPAIIICPSTLKWMWQRALSSILQMPVRVLESQTPDEHIEEDVIVVNYSILQYWKETLKRKCPKTIVADEGHMLSNRTSNRSKAAKELCRIAENVVIITGTPIINRPSELWHLLHLVRPDRYTSFFRFAQDYCNPRRNKWGWDFRGASNLDDLNLELQDVMIRRTKAEVMPDLPPKQRSVVPLPIESPKEYEKARKFFLHWMEVNKGKDKAARASKAEQIVKVGELKRLAAKLKTKSILQWVEDFFTESAPDSKLVLFAVHKGMIKTLHEKIPQKSVVVDGSTSNKARQEAVDRFQTDNSTRVFIGNIQAAGVGITLTRADTLAFCELDWRPALHMQAESRIHRIGQDQTSWIYYLLAKGTIEEKLAAVIQQKQETLNLVMDGEDNGEELDVFDMLMESY